MTNGDSANNQNKLKKYILVAIAIIVVAFAALVVTCRVWDFGLNCTDNGMCRKNTIACNNTPTNPCANVAPVSTFTLGKMCTTFAEGQVCDPGFWTNCHCKTVKIGPATLNCSCQ